MSSLIDSVHTIRHGRELEQYEYAGTHDPHNFGVSPLWRFQHTWNLTLRHRIRVLAGPFADRATGERTLLELLVKHGYTSPKWWQWWRWGNGDAHKLFGQN